jgi:transketolase
MKAQQVNETSSNMDTIAFARAVRIDALHMVYKAKASHVGSCYSIADIIAVLYGRVMRLGAGPADPGRDRFILSKGHAAAIVYAALARIGVLPRIELDSYGQDGARLMTHISHKIRGVEFSTGSLGHGLPFGVGKALAAHKRGNQWRTFVLMSDGEMDEGSNWEALMFAAHHHLNNLVVIVDYNKLQSLDTVARTLGLEPLVDKLQAFGWSVREIDGHDHLAIGAGLRAASASEGKPTIVLAHTIKGKGIGFMENRVEWHYRSPNKEELVAGLRELERADA